MYNKTAVKKLKKLFREKYPEYIEKVVLFGSRISDIETEYADYDILVVLKRPYDWRFKHKLYELAYEISLQYDIIIDIKVISKDELNSIKGKQPFILQALEKGLVL